MTPEQGNLGIHEQPSSVEEYRFDQQPIRGYPELRWQGKRPFTSTRYYPAQRKEVYGPAVNGWRNRIYWGDNLQVMSHLLKEFRGEVDLVYIDPPFDSKADYGKEIRLKGHRISGERSPFEEKQFTDIWTNDGYLQWMYERLSLIRELLANSGAIVVHLDHRQVHRLRLVMDELFGTSNFRNEIIWHYGQRTAERQNRLDNKHDNLLLYGKSGEMQLYETTVEWDYEDFVQHRHDIMKDENGEEYVLTDGGPGGGRYRRYVKDILASGKPLDTVWDLPLLNSSDRQRQGYPTQKPDYLLERVVRMCTKPGDLVMDCFMGSATTQAVAMKLGRRFIGADINLGAVQITTKRLLQVAEELQGTQLTLDEDIPDTFYTGFEVYNVNHYDIFRNPVEARDLLLEALEVQRLPAGHLFDGEKDGRLVKLMPVNRIATRADLNELIAGLDYRAFEHRRTEHPSQPVEKVTLVCMGHEPDLAAVLQQETQPYTLDIQVVDILRDRDDLVFKRDAEALVEAQDGELVISAFYPMNLLQKLSLQKEKVDEWRELVESVMIDWNYDGAVLQPAVVDIPDKDGFVLGRYPIADDAGTIRVKITDLLSESLEVELPYG